MSQPKFFTLKEANSKIQEVVSNVFKTAFWVKAEINKLNYQGHTGHAYPELVEKENGKIVAEGTFNELLKNSKEFKKLWEKYSKTHKD